MKRALLSIVFLLAATSAFASDSTAVLDFGNFSAKYSVALTGDQLTGRQENLGWGSGAVALQRKDGNWEGMFGFSRITSRKLTKRSETSMQYEFSVLPGGSYTAYITRKGDKTDVTLDASSLRAYSTLRDGKYLNGGNGNISMDLQKKNDTTWSGTTRVNNGRSFESAQTDLTATGDLNPEALAKADPELFVILYILPYNYQR